MATTELDKLINKELKSISTLPLGTKEAHSAHVDVKTLYELKLAEQRQIDEALERKNARMAANRLKSRELYLKEMELGQKERQDIRADTFKQAELANKNAETQEKMAAEKSEKRKERALSIAEIAVKVVLGVISTVGPLMLYGACVTEGFRFEETGAISSNTFKGVLNKVNPTKL